MIDDPKKRRTAVPVRAAKESELDSELLDLQATAQDMAHRVRLAETILRARYRLVLMMFATVFSCGLLFVAAAYSRSGFSSVDLPGFVFEYRALVATGFLAAVAGVFLHAFRLWVLRLQIRSASWQLEEALRPRPASDFEP